MNTPTHNAANSVADQQARQDCPKEVLSPEQAPMAENELQKVYRRLHELASKMKDLGFKSKSCEVLYEAAVIIERQISSNSFEPAVDGEIEKLARWVEVRGELACDPQYDINFKRIAAILRQQQAPAPVPADERPWERDGWCNEEGECWMGDFAVYDYKPVWKLCRPEDSSFLRSLPHWAFPVPSTLNASS